ncbi:HpcH/HpaI aldolase/citrate lyase family protein [Geodermatophilus sp. SYSU D01176]
MSALAHLYVPGNAPDRFDKAVASGAGAVILDLEDAVAAAAKDDARAAVASWVRGRRTGGTEVWVRVDGGERGDDDVRAVGAAGLTGVVVPKVGDRGALERLDAVLAEVEEEDRVPRGTVAVCPLVETAAGLLEAAAIARGPRVSHLQLGEADLVADLGVDPGPDGAQLLFARSLVVTASAAAGIAPPLAPVDTDFRDLTAFERSTDQLRRLGFVGRACIHPRQVPVVDAVFTPAPADVGAARDVLARLADQGSNVAVDRDGRMIDEAVARQARRVLARARPERSWS